MLLYKPFLKKSGIQIVIIKPIKITARFLTLGEKVLIWHNARIEGVSEYAGTQYSPSININYGVTIQQNLHLTCAKKIIIGNNTAVAANVSITDIEHGYADINVPPEQQPITVTEVIIGNNCKIYNNAVILPGTVLGLHNIVGANAVVKGVFPDYCVIVGAPAKIVKRYNPITQRWDKTDPKGNFII